MRLRILFYQRVGRLGFDETELVLLRPDGHPILKS